MIPTKRISRSDKFGGRPGTAEYVYLVGLAVSLIIAVVLAIVYWVSAGDVSLSTVLEALFD